jgi:hypothetical protein
LAITAPILQRGKYAKRGNAALGALLQRNSLKMLARVLTVWLLKVDYAS